MEAIANTVQADHNFGGVPLGSFGPDITPVWDLPSFNGGIEIKEASADGLMSVSITGDTDHFFVRDIYIMEWIWRPVDPGELPPGHRGPLPKERVLEVVNFSEGTRPIEVTQGQFVLVRTSYAAGFVGGTFNATVIIQADTWDTITVSLSLFIADVKTNPSSILNIAQGQKATLPFDIQSIAGRAVDVHFEMSPTQLHTGLTLTPNNFSLLPTEEKTILLEFTADTNAPIGSEEVALDQYAFRRMGFFFTANITHAQVTVNPLIPNKIFVQRRGTSVNIPISVQLNGPAVDIHFSTVNLPSDVSIQGFGQQFFNDETMNTSMLVGNAVPDEFKFIIVWETQWGQKGAMNFSVVIIEAETISLSTSVITPDGIAISGSVEMELFSNGNYIFKGHMRATGLPSYNYGLQVFIKAADGVILTAFHSGSIFGTDTPGDRENSWEENLNSPLISGDLWLSIRNNPAIQYTFNANIGGVIGTVWDIAKAGLEIFVGFMAGGVIGAGIVLGSELMSAAGIPAPPGLVVGIAVVGGAIVIFGPGAVIPAFVAGAVAGVAVELLIKNRPIHPDEMDFARQIFGTTLDEKFNNNKIWITNLSYKGGTKYTIPTVVEGLILLNLDTAYDDPVNHADSNYPQKGEVFIHELTHACQIAANKFVPGMICNAPGTYGYADDPQWAQRSWGNDFTREQQAHIVNDWYGTFRGTYTNLQELSNNLNSKEALQNPAFLFITKCRAGIF